MAGGSVPICHICPNGYFSGRQRTLSISSHIPNPELYHWEELQASDHLWFLPLLDELRALRQSINYRPNEQAKADLETDFLPSMCISGSFHERKIQMGFELTAR